MSVDFLGRLPLFAEASPDDLQGLWQEAEAVNLAAGEWLLREGETGDALYVVLEGSIEIIRRSGNQDVLLARRAAGELVGEMALLENAPRTASVRAVDAARLLKFGRESFASVLRASPATALALLRTASNRLQSTEALLIHNEKMASLGTLAAGLAHELNNPAAAVQRSAQNLQTTLDEWQALNGRLMRLVQSAAQADVIDTLRADLVSRAGASADIDPVARSEREGALQGWLEERGVDEAWLLAPTLVGAGYGPESLAAFDGLFSAPGLGMLAGWMASTLNAHALLGELRAGAERMSSIVKAVRAYSYLDQAAVQQLDLHEGLENTLILLRHKLARGVRVRREFADDLPAIEAQGSELNQVWTNLVDNAIDAMDGRGDLTLRTATAGDRVRVEVIDSGPGIPADILPRIFDPFYTTKPPGRGTGLGLHIAHSIVARHGGHIAVEAASPGACFVVTLPILLQKG